LLAKLDSQAVRFDAAFWLMNAENGNWRLYLGAPSVRDTGSLAYYGKVDEILMEMGFGVRLWAGMVTIEDMRSKIMQAMIAAFGNAVSVDGIRLSNEAIGGTWVPACVLYRVTAG
jgi:hypothetical protein